MACPPLPISATCLTLRSCIRATLTADSFAIFAPPSVYVGNDVPTDWSSGALLSWAGSLSAVVVSTGCGCSCGFGLGCGGGTGTGCGCATGCGAVLVGAAVFVSVVVAGGMTSTVVCDGGTGTGAGVAITAACVVVDVVCATCGVICGRRKKNNAPVAITASNRTRKNSASRTGL